MGSVTLPFPSETLLGMKCWSAFLCKENTTQVSGNEALSSLQLCWTGKRCHTKHSNCVLQLQGHWMGTEAGTRGNDSAHRPQCQGTFYLAVQMWLKRLWQLQVNCMGLSIDFQLCNNRVKTIRATLWATTATCRVVTWLKRLLPTL